MKKNPGSWILLLVLPTFFLGSCKTTSTDVVERGVVYVTTTDKKALLEKMENRISAGDSSSDIPLIEINTETSYQTIDGFGYALTGGSAGHIASMDEEARKELLQELFGVGKNDIGLSYLRVSIGSSDLNEEIYSYNDLPEGETDEDMSEFSLDPDREHVIPILKEILEINPDIKIMASPWSPPVWMKTFDIPVETDRPTDLPPTVGGGLNPLHEAAYALYFVKYIEGMTGEGITIDAVTIQNEPYHHRNNPSLHMEPEQMRDFIKNHLGPAFTENNIDTKILIWDHNADRPEYPISILNDPEAKAYIEGSAFHLYNGSISALSTVKQAHPDKNIYFTEQYQDSRGEFGTDLVWNAEHLIIGATRNWSKVVLHWNLTNNTGFTPFTPYGGCSVCKGAVTVEGNGFERNVGYYITAHASKFVRPGSVRIASNQTDELLNVAFKNISGDIVLIVLNKEDRNQEVNISVDGELYSLTIIRNSISTILL
ncbi:MAG: glycoside hydrolase family 30 protein [Balneola sp.]